MGIGCYVDINRTEIGTAVCIGIGAGLGIAILGVT